MSSKNDLLDRLAPLVPRPENPLEDFHRMRRRKHRNERIRAGVLGVAVVVASALIATGVIGSTDRTADRPTPRPSDSFRRRGGEILHAVGGPNPVDPLTGKESSGDLMAVDPSTGDQRVLVGRAFIETGRIGHAAWSADGRWVAYDLGSASPLWVANGEGRPRRLTQHARAWAWAPTDPRLALIRDSRLTIIDVASGRETDLGSTASNDISGPVWSPDGTRIVFGERGGTLHSVDVANGDRSVFVRLGRGLDSVDGIEWSPDGAHIAIVVDLDIGDRRLYVANGDGSDPRVVVDDFEPGGWPVWVADPSPETAWSPDGTTLAYPSFSAPNDRLLRIWTVSLDGSAPRLVASNLNDECCIDGGGPAWSPDGSQIAFELGTVTERHVVVNADGAGDTAHIDEPTYQSWRNPGGWYFCYCYG